MLCSHWPPHCVVHTQTTFDCITAPSFSARGTNLVHCQGWLAANSLCIQRACHCRKTRRMTKKRKRSCNTPEEALEVLRKKTNELSSLLHAKKRRRRHRTLQRDGIILYPFMKTVLVLLYVFAGYETSLAQSYWENKRKQKKRLNLPSSETRRRIEDFFLSGSDEALATLLDPSVT